MNKKPALAIGLMSGTSADGLTVCLFDAGGKKVLHYKTYPYTKKFQNKILNAANLSAPGLSELNYELGQIYAALVKKFLREFDINPCDIAVIGSHGQTMCHNPRAKIKNTLQLGEPAFMAREFDIPVAHNFRAALIAAGGTGAPLMPAFDDFLFSCKEPAVLLNIGGISNVSAVGRGIKTLGFDIGPGNVMIDTAVNIVTSGRQNFDKDGALAARYAPDIKKAESMLKIFVKKAPPKSLDRNFYSHNFIKKHFKNLKPRDVSTITYLTALVIAQSIKKFVLSKYDIKTVFVSGGGIFNKAFMRQLRGLLPAVKVLDFNYPGLPPMSKEAAAFAYFALQTLKGRRCVCPDESGAVIKTVLGSLTPKCGRTG